MGKSLLVFWMAVLFSACLAAALDEDFFARHVENERISLPVLLEVFAQDASGEILHYNYEDKGDMFLIKSQWRVTGEEKKTFLKNFAKWLDAEAAELVAFDGFRDIVKDWFSISMPTDNDMGCLIVSQLPMEPNVKGNVGPQYVRITYIRPNEQHLADCFVWTGKMHQAADVVPQLPAGQELYLDIERLDSDLTRRPAWCENLVRFVIRNLGGKPIRLRQATAVSNSMKIKFTPCVLPAHGQTILEISVKPGTFSGKFVREVLLETDAPGQEWLRLKVGGEMLPAVQVMPELEQHDANGKVLPMVTPRQANRVFEAQLGDQEVWLGNLRPGETRIQSFLLTPYDDSFQLTVMKHDGEAEFNLVPIPGGYRLDVAVCPAQPMEETVASCIIDVDISEWLENDAPESPSFTSVAPQPLEIKVRFTALDGS